jgi:hypothetical protein
MREGQPCAQFTRARQYGLEPDPPESPALHACCAEPPRAPNVPHPELIAQAAQAAVAAELAASEACADALLAPSERR